MAKSAQAFRTIREVADWLDVAAHVLRFWESKFNQIKPVKRAGGRRYYRPADMELVGGIKVLLHDRGLTIRGVQKIIADEGLEAVTSLSPPVDELIGDAETIDMEAAADWAEDTTSEEDTPPETVEVVDNAGLEEHADVAAPDEDDSAAPDPVEPEQEHEPEDPPEPDTLQDAVVALFPQDDTSDLAEPPAGSEQAPEPATEPAKADTPAPLSPQISASPAEGPLGTLAAIARLPSSHRAALGPQITALAQLR